MKRNIPIIKSSMLPNFITICNGICGFSAIYQVLKVDIVFNPNTIFFTADAVDGFAKACWFILLGMVFDLFDGWAARATGAESAIGAQLDSLCDLVTFGLAPALLILKLNMIYSKVWVNMTWCFCLIYFLAAILRLARFNADSQTSEEEDDHSSFKGLPTPAAAGCVVTLMLFYCYIARFEKPELNLLINYKESIQIFVNLIPDFLPFLAACLGFTMIYSRLKFGHMGSILLNREFSIESLGTLMIIGSVVLTLPEVTLPIIFLGYMLGTPVKYILSISRRTVTRRRSTDPTEP